MLREQLEIVRRTMQEQAQASGREIFALTEELESAQVLSHDCQMNECLTHP